MKTQYTRHQIIESIKHWKNVLKELDESKSPLLDAFAEKFGEDEIKGMQKRCNVAFDDYDNFKTVIPKWYKDNSDKYLNM